MLDCLEVLCDMFMNLREYTIVNWQFNNFQNVCTLRQNLQFKKKKLTRENALCIQGFVPNLQLC